MSLFSATSLRLLSGATLLAGGLLQAPGAHAQTSERKTAIGVNISTLQYQGNLGADFWQLQAPQQVGIGGHISQYLSPSFDVSLLANYQNYRFVSASSVGTEFNSQVGMIDLGLKLKLANGRILKEDAFIQPYLTGGGGVFLATNTGNYFGLTSTGARIGNYFQRNTYTGEVFGLAGIRFRLSSVVALDVTTSQHYPFNDGFDNIIGDDSKPHDRFLVHSVGLTFALGKAKDTDGDGVPDNKDKCPDTPAGVKVDVTGCPLDTDGDGVPDYQDKCPDVKGLVALQGCPDTDGDGVTDADDKCPNTPAGVKVDATGCPLDSDGDKVSDDKDKCPNTPAGVQVDATGCPLDRDGDGIPDYQDKCPDQAGTAANQGCPEIKAEDKKVLNEATKYINFAFNKATLLPSSFKRLDQIVRILGEYPNYSLSIAGHTDSKGNDKANLKLSYDRAASARTYLLSKGIPAERIEARGYGETKPIADNASAAGQAQNRRVDFDLYLTGSTNSAETKYGPAPTVADMLQQAKESPTKAVKKAPAKRKASGKRKAPARRR